MPREAEAARSEREYDDLTPRERQVLELMAQGLSNLGIAKRLCVGERSIEKYAGNVFWKLGFFPEAESDYNRRVQAVCKFLAEGVAR